MREKCYTLGDLMDSPDEMLTAEQIAPVLRVDQQTLRMRARLGLLPFPVFINRRRVLFPRAGLIKFLEG